MTYSSSFQDGMLRLGDTWVRASQIESVKMKPGQAAGTEHVTVTLLSGRTFTVDMSKGGAKDIARKAVGL